MGILNSFISFQNLSNDHFIIVFVGYVVCFISLFILCVVFDNLPKILQLNIGGLLQSKKNKIPETKVNVDDLTGEEMAAISAAIFLFVADLHDEENRVLTIQKISRRYSPWSSKIYSVTNGLNKRF
jgi:glutaconyl-CoA/methylmalonyl-CoA decarboxylase subunit delta